MTRAVCLVALAFLGGCQGAVPVSPAARSEPTERNAYEVRASSGEWELAIRMEPWDGRTPAEEVVAYGFIDYYAASGKVGENPRPVSFNLTYKGEPVAVPYAMYSDLFYLRNAKIELTSEGCIVHFDGAEAGGRYFGKVLVKWEPPDPDVRGRYVAYRRVAWTRDGEEYSTEIDW